MRVGLRQFSAETVGWLLARALTAARVALTAAVRTVLCNGLKLLGVPTPDAM